jgi:hypothetical protein
LNGLTLAAGSALAGVLGRWEKWPRHWLVGGSRWFFDEDRFVRADRCERNREKDYSSGRGYDYKFEFVDSHRNLSVQNSGESAP